MAFTAGLAQAAKPKVMAEDEMSLEEGSGQSEVTAGHSCTALLTRLGAMEKG